MHNKPKSALNGCEYLDEAFINFFFLLSNYHVFLLIIYWIQRSSAHSNPKIPANLNRNVPLFISAHPFHVYQIILSNLFFFSRFISFIVCMEWKIEMALRIALLFLCVVQCTLGKSIQNQRYYLQSRRSIPCRQQTTSNRMINKEQNTNWHW